MAAILKYKLIEPLINVKILIEEVRKRPVIWTSSSPKDLPLRRVQWVQWGEVALEALGIEKWQTFDTAEKNSAIQVVQKRFKNMRTCYFREARRQQYEMEHMCANKKRRPYLYFKELSFLSGNCDADGDGEELNSSEGTQIDSNCVDDRSCSETDSSEKVDGENKSIENDDMLQHDGENVKDKEKERKDQPVSDTPETLNTSNNTAEFCECDDVREVKTEPITRQTDTENEEVLTTIPTTAIDHGHAISLISKLQLLHEFDENELFLMSLLPRIRSLTGLQQLNVQIEILQTLRRAQEPQNQSK